MYTPEKNSMTEFTKTKMHFALALLATLFALHHILEKFGETIGFDYLGYFLPIYYPYALIGGLLALTVYFYALALLSERAYSLLEKTGNYCYAVAILILPLYGGLYLSSLAADHLGQAHLAWTGPTVIPLGLGILWLVLSQVAAWWFRARLSDKDRDVTLEHLAQQEIAALERARDMFASHHYDLSVIEAWKAIELRLRRALLIRGKPSEAAKADVLIHRATRAGLLSKSALALIHDLREHWKVAVGTEPLTREAADVALAATRNILSTIPVEQRESKGAGKA
jgi:hypothetical protein